MGSGFWFMGSGFWVRYSLPLIGLMINRDSHGEENKPLEARSDSPTGSWGSIKPARAPVK
jgi:hypothetical protein